MGLFPNPDLDPKLEQSRLDGFASLLRNGGTKFSIYEDIQIQKWEKVVRIMAKKNVPQNLATC